MHCGSAEGGPEGSLHHRVYHTAPGAKIDRGWHVVSRVEEVGFWKIVFMHCVYFKSVR